MGLSWLGQGTSIYSSVELGVICSLKNSPLSCEEILSNCNNLSATGRVSDVPGGGDRAVRGVRGGGASGVRGVP